MKIRLFTIPNMLTLGNLVCGSVATIAIIGSQDIKLAFWLVIIAAVFDFFDGFTARLLKSSSAIGGELDSLADMVSFGLVPALAMYYTFLGAPQISNLSAEVMEYAAYISLIIVAFSALRLAKFNVDDTQHAEFCGLPTPANALFCLSLASLIAMGEFSLAKEWILLISAVMAYLLISPIRMFALKFKGFGLRGNEIRYGFILFSAIMVIAFTKYAIPAIIITYIVVSAIRWAINRNKE